MNGGMGRVAVVCAFVAVLAAGASFVVFKEDVSSSAVDIVETTTTTAVVVDQPTYVATNEIPLGPAVLAPSELEIDGDDAALRFDLVHVAPVLNEPTGWVFQPFRGWDVVPAAELATVFPDQWTLLIGDEEYPGEVANLEARAARFKVPAGTTGASVEGVRIDRYRILYPVDIPFAIGVDETVEVVDGVTATILQVTEQASTTLVRIELVADDDVDLSHTDIVGVGAGWQSAVRGVDGEDVWSLTFDGEFTLPISVSFRGSIWLDVDTAITFEVGVVDG